MNDDDAPCLSFLFRGREAFRVRLHRKLLIGRGHACDVHLPGGGTEVSREHAIVRRRGDRIFVEDVSRFGTYLDGVPIGPGGRSMAEGTELRIGAWEVRLETPTGPADTETRPPWTAADRTRTPDLMGESAAFLGLLAEVRRIAPVKVPVLIEGETGTGKERIARAVHRWSGRALGPFEAINCGAIPDGTAQSELFGHCKGAFTGASSDRAGIFERAHGGTVLLDEVGELSAPHQAMLLRVLEERQVTRMGDRKLRDVDFRLIAATHRDLPAAVAAGEFREDLLYRLRVAHLEVPPLRDRGSDVVLLARHFLADASPGPAPRLSDGAVAALGCHRWPGNVRELRNAMQQALLNCRGRVIEPACLPRVVLHGPPQAALRPSPFRPADDSARAELRVALDAASGNRTQAARTLGISRSTLYDRMSRLWPDRRPRSANIRAMTHTLPTPSDVLEFWLGPLDDDGLADGARIARWYKKDPKFDEEIRERFGPLRDSILNGGQRDWLADPRGCLAAVVVLDQFSRNMHRDAAAMYAADPLALQFATEGLDAGRHRELEYDERGFLYMPFMHSEEVTEQDRGVELFAAEVETATSPAVRKRAEQVGHYARMHRDIVARFGRFPHRNAILGRESSVEESEFLAEPNSSF